MGDKKAVKTIRLPTPEGERIEELAEERDMTEADMYRHLIRQGLRVETGDESDSSGTGAGLKSEPLHADADTTFSQMSPVIQMAGGGLILLAATILLAVQLPAAAAATVAAAIGGAIGGSLR